MERHVKEYIWVSLAGLIATILFYKYYKKGD